MTFDDALDIVNRQSEMLAKIRERDLEARKRCISRLRLKLMQGHEPDNLEICFMQEVGLDHFQDAIEEPARQQALVRRRREQADKIRRTRRAWRRA